MFNCLRASIASASSRPVEPAEPAEPSRAEPLDALARRLESSGSTSRQLASPEIRSAASFELRQLNSMARVFVFASARLVAFGLSVLVGQKAKTACELHFGAPNRLSAAGAQIECSPANSKCIQNVYNSQYFETDFLLVV